MTKVGEKVIRSYIPDQHREFFVQLPFILVGSIDAAIQPTASVITGEPGFISSPGNQLIHIQTRILADDPLAKNLTLDSPLGLLGIQLHTKRRNRMNGWVIEQNNQGCLIEVQQSFGNCAKYITERYLEYAPKHYQGTAQISDQLNESEIQLINNADSFFIATAHPKAADPQYSDQGVDISHRGGKAGFVIAAPDFFRFPDYAGNYFFNSIGNLALNSNAGFIFFDFDKGDILQIEAEVDLAKASKTEIALGIHAWYQAKVKLVRYFPSTFDMRIINY